MLKKKKNKNTLVSSANITDKVQFLYTASTAIVIILFFLIMGFYYYLFKKVTTTIEQAHDIELLRGTVMEEVIDLKVYEEVETKWNEKFELEPPKIDRDPFLVIEKIEEVEVSPETTE